MFIRNLNQVHIKYHTISNRENGAHAGCTAFKIVHIALKSCTQGAGCTLNFEHCKLCKYLGPALNKKSFPVHRPGGLKRADWNFSPHIFPLFFFFYSTVYNFVYKNEIRKKKNPGLPAGRFFAHPAHRKRFFT